MNKEILVIGATGLVGSRFVELSKDKFKICTPDERELNIVDPEAVMDFVTKNKVDAIINFAAFTNVDEAEKQRNDQQGIAWQLNVEGPRNLTKVCKDNGIFLIQFSTDFVFPGNENNPGPYSEDQDPPETSDGIGWYGWTKNRAEKVIKESGCKYSIVRIAYPFYKSEYQGKLDFAKGSQKLFDENKLYPVFSDQTLSVLNVDNLVVPLEKIVSDEIEGVFHIVSRDTTTPFEFVSYLLEKTRNAKNILQEGSMKEFLSKEGRTPRPRLGGLKTEITELKLGIKFNTWREMVDELI